ncbi:uncharacterized protein LOC133819339 [Humulus lupulus]|uniref:uncharacterized protein LOC133819339 n=1 Tax=Humulus lupulus TaxID=3486 RepID=UPI002B413EEA|nr:uncharacterized protein LOC133819339 [Humulus lupulus]
MSFTNRLHRVINEFWLICQKKKMLKKKALKTVSNSLTDRSFERNIYSSSRFSFFSSQLPVGLLTQLGDGTDWKFLGVFKIKNHGAKVNIIVSCKIKINNQTHFIDLYITIQIFFKKNHMTTEYLILPWPAMEKTVATAAVRRERASPERDGENVNREKIMRKK